MPIRRGSRLHTREPKIEAENNLDPDDGNSILCDACCLPIFSTPFVSIGGGRLTMHDKCAANDGRFIPAKLEAHQLHTGGDLILHQHSTTSDKKKKRICSRCGSMCGISFYKCPDDDERCYFQLDLACALPMNSWIVHRSHPHRLTVIKTKLSLLSSSKCGVCVTQHHHHVPEAAAKKEWQVYYVCIPCDFWIHPDCALLPNAIQIDEKLHPHPLLLKYLNRLAIYGNCCAICGRWCGINLSEGVGVYECFHCGYSAHIKCALYDDHVSFNPVLIRDAQVPGLFRLPFPNESTSVMQYILTKTTDVTCSNTSTSTGSRSGDHHMSSDGGKLLLLTKDKKIHEHPLIIHDHHDPGEAVGGVARICNACVQPISTSGPFYTCYTTFNNNSNELAGRCRDFFLHMCCAHLPTIISTKHLSHSDENDILFLESKPDLLGQPFNMFMCVGCRRQSNGFAYRCRYCNDCMDVVCAFMHTPITHDAHAKSHILRPMTEWDINGKYNCCGHPINSQLELGYICNSCRNFRIHLKCALLPDTVTHKFDTHPLKLITTTQTLNTDDDHQLVRGEQMFCEICEKDIDDRMTWYYGCKECDNYFHTGCIPCVNRLSKIKFGFTVHVTCHDCPLTCVRALFVDGYPCQCGLCDRIIITEFDEIAFECSKCYFRIRKECVAREINRKPIN